MNDDINYIPSNTPDFQTELAEKLAELAPEVLADGKIDVEKLTELLDSDADQSNERFGLFWPGKRRALRAAQQPTTATLKPDLENSKDWDTTKNVFIEGDNLEVLKVLQKHYHGKVKMIYIDPPYNTGKDFVYPDNFKEGLDTYLEWTKQVNDEGQKLSTNSESEGRYHSNWLNMMYPRLKLARNLLRNDGIIFISIDDTELANLLKLCSEIFGEDKFAAQIIWKKRNTPPNDRIIGAQHDYIVAFARTNLKGLNYRPRSKEQVARYKNPDNHEKGPWTPGDLTANVKGGRYVESLNYPIINPNTGAEFWPSRNGNWRFSSLRMQELLDNNELYFGKDGKGAPKLKRFLSDVKSGTTWTTLWDFLPLNTQGTQEVSNLFETKPVFESPKPVGVIETLLQLATNPSDLIIDFFAGSATTAQAVMQRNAQDGGNRRHILVQLPEPTPERSVARSENYRTIAELSRERIRRAGEKIKSEFSSQLSERDTPLDVGFRAYRLADTNFAKWQVSSDTAVNLLEQHLLDLRESANDESTPMDLFVELLLKQGYSLTESIGDASIAGLDLKTVLDADGDVAVLAYLDEHTKPTLDQLREIADSKPVRFVILEDCFQGDDELKTNLVQICKTNGIELWTA